MTSTLHPVKLLAWVFFFAMVATSATGIYNNYSSVPFWDMWDGTIMFLLQFPEEPLKNLFSQHVDHRIVLTKLITLIDSKIFAGQFKLLFWANFVTPLLGVWSIWYIIHRSGVLDPFGISPVLCGLLFSLVQSANFYWAFQSQIFLVTYLPLVGYVLIFSGIADGKGNRVATGCVAAALSSIAMASGSFSLVPVVILFVAGRLPWRQTLAAAVAASGILGTYLAFYTPAHGMSETQSHLTLATGIEISIFVVRFFGNIFPKDISPMFGSVIFFGMCAAIFHWIFVSKKLDHSAALVSFQIYLLMMAISAALSRLEAGVGAADAVRYSTFSMAAIVSLLAYWYVEGRRYAIGALATAVTFFLAFAISGHQQYRMWPMEATLAQHESALVSMAAGSPLDEAVESIYPWPDRAIEIFRRSEQAKLPWFINNALIEFSRGASR